MANYLFELTCKKPIGKIPKGAKVQVASTNPNCTIKETLAAYQNQLGIETKSASAIGTLSTWFDIKKIK